ncbi:phage head closure protein [Lysinibacillus sp. KU-BSD001]|uniref:phage head closure protein n=1 Tax=Lysinibacillus sp. KU-BSD001 TaxID=3141328 RepID=UPI0036E2FBB3
MFKDIVTLVKPIFQEDTRKQKRRVDEEKREVFANKRSIAQMEFMQAAQAGIKARHCFIIRLIDYEEETELIYNDVFYSIYRVYEKGENIELYCEVRVGGS